MPASDLLREGLLNHILTDPALSPPATLYIALCAAAPVKTDTGSDITRVAYTNYVDLATTAADWSAANGDSGKTTTAAKTFAECGATGDTATHFALVTSQGGGDLYAYGMLATEQVPFFGLDSSDVIYAPGHGRSDDDRVVVLGPNLPSNLDPDVAYYVINSASNTLQLSLTSGGAAVSMGSDAFGRLGKRNWVTVSEFVAPYFGAGTLTLYMD